MRFPDHILTFIARCKKFTHVNGITSILKVDKDNTVEDVMDVSETTGGLIAEIDNHIAEIIDKLEIYYTSTNNKQALKRLEKVKDMY